MPRMTARDGDVLVTVMVHAGIDEDTFRDHAIVRTRIEKYVSRAPAAVTIGINQRDFTKPFELALWVEGAWEHDDILEEVVAEDRATPRKMQLLRKGKKPGRNDPCPCGSGAKFKHCCISRVTFTRQPANQSG